VSQKVDEIIISSDHAGYALKEFIISELQRRGIPIVDAGTKSTESTDYPMYAARVASAVAKGTYQRGITICGTGIGASITANRFKKVRAALCITDEMARLARQHNDANVLVLGGRITSQEDAVKILDMWLTTAFEGDRHKVRIRQIDEVS